MVAIAAVADVSAIADVAVLVAVIVDITVAVILFSHLPALTYLPHDVVQILWQPNENEAMFGFLCDL